MRKLAALLLVALTPSWAFAAIAFDSAVNGGTGAAEYHTWNHTITGGSGTLIVISAFKNTTPDDMTATVGGVAATKQATSQQGSDANKMSIFTFVATTSGLQVIQIRDPSVGGYMPGGSVAYTGADGGVTNTFKSANDAITSTTTAAHFPDANSWVVVGARWSGNDMSAGTGANERVNATTNYSIFDSGGAATSPHAMTISASSGNAGLVGIVISPTAAAVAGTPPDFGSYSVIWW